MKRVSVRTHYIIMVLVLLIGIFRMFSNPHRLAYMFEKPVSQKEVDEQPGFWNGYPAGDGVPVAKSVADIRENLYFTLEVSGENVERTRHFAIKDITEARNGSSKAGRNTVYSYIPSQYYHSFHLGSDLCYWLRQARWNFDDTSYGEFCVVTLESGEKVMVLLDLTMFDIPKGKKVRLPIGRRGNYRMEHLQTKPYAYDFNDVDVSWYVDMVGDWEKEETLEVVPLWLFLILLAGVEIWQYYLVSEKKTDYRKEK